MRRIALSAVMAVCLAAALATSACGAGPTVKPIAPQGAPEVSRSAEVVVPDIIAALEKHRPTPRYTKNPDATALMLGAYAEGALENAGLEPDIVFQPVSIPDSQEPAAGTVVPRGSVVHVRIGFGD